MYALQSTPKIQVTMGKEKDRERKKQVSPTPKTTLAMMENKKWTVVLGEFYWIQCEFQSLK